jgi:hypothetical protein
MTNTLTSDLTRTSSDGREDIDEGNRPRERATESRKMGD